MSSKAESLINSLSCENKNNGKECLPSKSLLEKLKNKYGVIYENFVNSNNILKCVYCQDSYMKDVFNFYPDRLCVDITHKYCDTNLFMFIFLCEDSNGRNEIISFCFSISDDSDVFSWILSTFKKHNPNWRKTKIIALDPEIKHKEIVRTAFPAPYMIICFHHAYKAFKKGIENVKVQNSLSNEQMQYALELFKSMYNAHSQSEYELFLQQFLVLHSSIVFYFQESWLTIHHLWRIGLDFFHENIFSSLNCHLENIDNTFKSVFISENNLSECFEKFYVVLSLKRNEKTNLIVFTNPIVYSRFSTEYQISKVLTPYAAKFVIDQYDLSSEIYMDSSVLSDNYYFDNLGSPVNASVSMCQCQFFLYTFLPCRHILAVRKTLSVSAFDETLIEYSWTMKYYQNTLSSLQGTVNAFNNLLLKEQVSKQKFVSQLLEFSLPSLIESSPLAESRIELLNQLICLWKSDKDVYLQFEGIEKESSIQKSVLRCNNLLNTDNTLISSQVCKTEYDLNVEQSPTFSQLDKPLCLSKKIPVSSKTFKMEYTTFKINSSVEEPRLINSPALSEMSFRQSKWNFKSKILDGSHVNYAYLCRIICDSKETCIDWLRQMELICTSMLCPTCGCGMTLKLVSRLSDGAVWVCSNDMEVKKSCSRRCSVRRGSWFELTNMSFEQILTFCYMWINGFSQNQILSETGISTATYISWNKLNKRVCEECLMEDPSYCASKMGSVTYAQVLEMWLQKCAGEDSFLKFLQDANTMYRKDSVKHSMG